MAFIPPSGFGAGYFHRLRRALGTRVVFRSVELPGHGRRYQESPLTDAALAITDVTERLGGPVDAIYGESLGAYVGLAVAAAARVPALIVAANSPPSVRERIRTEEIASIDDAVVALTALGGEVPAEVLRDPELAERAYPVLRADLHLSQSFIESTRDTKVDCDLQVLAGLGDTASADLDAWAAHTTGRCAVTRLPGGHLLSAGDPAGVADVIVNLLARR